MIKQHSTKFGRFYETPGGVFPSVTTVLSSVPNPSLDEWRKSIGEQEATRMSLAASRKGTRLHSYCEAYLLKQPLPKLDLFDKAAFKGIDSVLSQIKPIAIEKFLFSRQMRVAGGMDCLCKLDGKLCVLDFKTSRREKFPGEFDSYWVQTSAYAQMLQDEHGINVDHLCIVMQLDGETRVFWERKERWINTFRDIRSNFKYNEEEILHEIQENQRLLLS